MGSMERLILPRILTAVVLNAFFCGHIVAQTVNEIPANSPKVKVIHPVEIPVPFSLAPVKSADSIEFRTIDQMTQGDRNLEAGAESSIGERTRFVGIEFNQGNWSYEQVVCPALPNHVFLRYLRKGGTGDESLFFASIPRDSNGRVRIIPILLRGYSLFSPAPINAMTISAFNRIRAEEHFDTAPEWLETALCYAALAGSHPQVARGTEDPESMKSRVAMPAKLEIQDRGDVIISFADISASPRPMEWTMIFDRKGKLLKATHKSADLNLVKVVHPTSIAVKSHVVVPTQERSKPVDNN